MKTVITYGTYDVLHHGHINLLRRARELGDRLIVGVSTDEFNALKGKQAYFRFEERKLIVESIRFVDRVIAEHTWEQKIRDIEELGVDTFVMGDDWAGKFDYLRNYCEVVCLPRTEGVSSGLIKAKLMAVPSRSCEPAAKV